VAIAALVLWLCTAGIGTYMLATATRFGAAAAEADVDDPEPVTVPGRPVTPAGLGTPAAPAGQSGQTPPAKVRDPFAPPSLQRERSESLPLMRSLIEFTHPALAMIGLGFWFGYVVSHDRTFLAIGLGIMLGAIAAGATWFTANHRAVKRVAAADAAGQSSGDPRFAPQAFSPRVLILHGVGAALTLLIAALITARA
jgi:hypothetical protein